MDKRAKALEEAGTTLSAETVAEVVADDATRYCAQDHKRKEELVRGTGIHRGGQEHGLPGQWHTEAVHRDAKQDGPVAVGHDQVRQRVAAVQVRHGRILGLPCSRLRSAGAICPDDCREDREVSVSPTLLLEGAIRFTSARKSWRLDFPDC